MTKIKYISIQLFILILPPFIFAFFYHINESLNSFETFVGYSCGIIGFFIMYLTYLIVDGEALLYIILFPLILIIHFYIFNYLFSKDKDLKLSIIINIVFVAWKLLFGIFWMYVSML